MDGIQGSKIRNSCDSSLVGMKCNTAAEWGRGACDLIMYYIINGSEKKNDGSNWILCGGEGEGAQLSINWQKE